LLWVIAISIALGMDAFSFALAIGLVGIQNKLALHLSITVAMFHVFMPLVGLWAGQKTGTMVGEVAVGIGASILLCLGIKMFIGAIKRDKKGENIPDIRGIGMYVLAGSVSIDALSVGFSLGTMDNQIILTILIMGFTAGIMTVGGIVLGRKIGTKFGGKAEALGGIILFIIGLQMGIAVIS